jgi:hypothetical protein
MFFHTNIIVMMAFRGLDWRNFRLFFIMKEIIVANILKICFFTFIFFLFTLLLKLGWTAPIWHLILAAHLHGTAKQILKLELISN